MSHEGALGLSRTHETGETCCAHVYTLTIHNTTKDTFEILSVEFIQSTTVARSLFGIPFVYARFLRL